MELQLQTTSITKEDDVKILEPQKKERSGDPIALPVIHYFHSDKDEISLGKPVILEWSVEGADKVWLEPEIGEMATSKGEIEVYPTESTYFILKAENSGGTIPEVVELVCHYLNWIFSTPLKNTSILDILPSFNGKLKMLLPSTSIKE